MTSQDSIKREIYNFFSDVFKANDVDNDVMQYFTSDLPTLSATQRDQLDSLPSLEELTLSLASLPTGKSPGLDGLPVEFYKSFWSFLVQSFWRSLLVLYSMGNCQ